MYEFHCPFLLLEGVIAGSCANAAGVPPVNCNPVVIASTLYPPIVASTTSELVALVELALNSPTMVMLLVEFLVILLVMLIVTFLVLTVELTWLPLTRTCTEFEKAISGQSWTVS